MFDPSVHHAIAGILTAIATKIELNQPALAGYQVGSSLLGPSADYEDLDLLFVDLEATSAFFPGKFFELRTAIAAGRPRSGAFDSTASSFKTVIRSVIESIDSQILPDSVFAEYSFGPITSDLPLRRPLLVLHICGPLATADLDEMAAALPFHTLAFLTKNRPIFGPPYESLQVRPHPSAEDLRTWNQIMLKLAKSSAPAAYRLKAIRKMILCRHLYLGDPLAYEKAAADAQELGGHQETGMDLHDLAQSAFNLSIAGI